MEHCVICGAELVDGKCPNQEFHFKKMCLNCDFFVEGRCENSENMQLAREKFLSSVQVPSGYEIDTLTFKPVQLKDPTKKCGRYEFNEGLVLETLKN